MKDVEILGEAPGEIRAGNESGAATVARANLRRAHEKIVNPEGIASEHRSPNEPKPNQADQADESRDHGQATNGRPRPRRRSLIAMKAQCAELIKLLDRPSDR